MPTVVLIRKYTFLLRHAMFYLTRVILFLKTYFNYVYICASGCGFVHMCAIAQGDQRHQIPGTGGTKLVSHLKWVPGSSRGTDYTTNCWTISASHTDMHTHMWAHTHIHGYTHTWAHTHAHTSHFSTPLYKTMLGWGYSSECAVSI